MNEAKRSTAAILYGTDEPVEPPRVLAVGALSVSFSSGNLSGIRWGGLEVVRAIAFLARDLGWGTYRPVISEVDIAETDTGFTAAYAAHCDGEDGSFDYRAEIHGQADGVLTFRVRGRTDTGFQTNRTGFVVLHPLDGVVGRKVAVEHASGDRETVRFPELVSPDQPIFDIRELVHEPRPGLQVTVRMEGDTFEMEDHRNWTDASFKTYVRPLALGFPYTIEPGETLEQAVTVRISGAPPRMTAPKRAGVVIGSASGALPRVGLFAATDSDIDCARKMTARVGALRPPSLTGRIDMRKEPLQRLAALTDLAGAMSVPLGLEVVIPGIDADEELAALAPALAARTLDSIFVIPARDLKSRPANATPPGEATAEAILAAARRIFPGQRIGGGMPVGFPELNRNRPPRGIDFVTHATQATYHDADDLSVMQTLEALPYVFRSVRVIAGNIPYRLGPSTIGLPESAAAARPVPNPARQRVAMTADDPRAGALFGAAFALGLVAEAARAGIETVTLAKPSGPFGLLDADGTTRPVAAVFAGIADLAGAAHLATSLTGTDTVATMAAQKDGRTVLWLANLRADPVAVEIPGGFRWLVLLDAAELSRGPIDAVVAKPFDGSRIVLDAYAVARLE